MLTIKYKRSDSIPPTKSLPIATRCPFRNGLGRKPGETPPKPKRKEKQKMYTVTFSNEELEEMKANDAVVIVSCDDDNGHRLY